MTRQPGSLWFHWIQGGQWGNLARYVTRGTMVYAQAWPSLWGKFGEHWLKHRMDRKQQSLYTSILTFGHQYFVWKQQRLKSLFCFSLYSVNKDAQHINRAAELCKKIVNLPQLEENGSLEGSTKGPGAAEGLDAGFLPHCIIPSLHTHSRILVNGFPWAYLYCMTLALPN